MVSFWRRILTNTRTKHVNKEVVLWKQKDAYTQNKNKMTAEKNVFDNLALIKYVENKKTE